ncbi:DUF4136 domain-containing protein [Novosphingobium sp. KCTC 2891]|uniref:DUF4136 domain-containing protein n=1 Tax=Novosphingobium sp. KCTC 2891 TaxID=2989730 RepID=UPI0022219B8F|nr:DUF4136 domain-containing protein [Novosphingobium sp. KCTC 2891]MCW1382386.1 DUF4136 domain-containing protein [Novosphingobium sp. KCTC 2891]
MTHRAFLLPLLLAAAPLPALAQPFPGGGPMGDDGWRSSRMERGGRQSAQPARGVEVTAYRAADAGDRLGKGRIVIAALDGGEAEWKLPVYEAAVVDELARRGYDTVNAADPGQVAQVGVSHRTVVPEEAPHKPVSGEMSTYVSNRGSGYGLALNVDLSKPRKAIVETRLDVRIRDKASGQTLWEGHAEAQSREGDAGLDNGAVAARLAAALFAKFPEGQMVDVPRANP